MSNKKENKVYKIWWIWLIAILLGFLIALAIVDINWFTNTKYKIDPLYCEKNSDCTLDVNCDPINVYSVGEKKSFGECLRTIDYCQDFKCEKKVWTMRDAEE